jgi:hypothetical protein
MKTIPTSPQHESSMIQMRKNPGRLIERTIALALGILLLAACGSRQTAPGTETEADSLIEASVAVADSLPSPDASTALPAHSSESPELDEDQQKKSPVPQPDRSTPDVSKLGQIKGILVDKESGKTMKVSPFLFRDQLETDTEDLLEEVRKYMDKMELQIDSLGVFLFTGVPYGQYVVAIPQEGVVTSAFKLSPGQLVDLGKIEVEK